MQIDPESNRGEQPNCNSRRTARSDPIPFPFFDIRQLLFSLANDGGFLPGAPPALLAVRSQLSFHDPEVQTYQLMTGLVERAIFCNNLQHSRNVALVDSVGSE